MPKSDNLSRHGSILTARDRLTPLAAVPGAVKLYASATQAERLGRIGIIGAAIVVCGSIGFAVVAGMPTATSHYATQVAPRSSKYPSVPLSVPRVSTPVATDPLRWEDLTLMLRAGLRDEEIIAQVKGKQLVFSMDPAREDALRSLGAGNQLLDFLRTRRVYVAPAMLQAVRVSVAAPLATPAPPAYQSPLPDYAARDRQVQSLKTQIDALDEQVRCIRANPKDGRYWPHYYGQFNGIDQQKLDAYLENLDQQRNDLRRQKWRLEGR